MVCFKNSTIRKSFNFKRQTSLELFERNFWVREFQAVLMELRQKERWKRQAVWQE
jgi:hypothetical protein